MHHFRGKLFQGDETRLDPANVYIEYHATGLTPPRGGPATSWSHRRGRGAGGTYTLKLEDGRSGQLQIDAFSPDDSGKFRATFVGEGPLG